MTPTRAISRNPSPVGAAIRELRIERGIRQAELARKVACYPGHLKRIESGKRNPSEVLLSRIARELHTEVAKLRGAA